MVGNVVRVTDHVGLHSSPLPLRHKAVDDSVRAPRNGRENKEYEWSDGSGRRRPDMDGWVVRVSPGNDGCRCRHRRDAAKRQSEQEAGSANSLFQNWQSLW